jgi:hypothetical protein
MNSLSKFTFLFLVITASFIITSCDKVAELFKADITFSDTISFVIPKGFQITSIDTSETVQFNVDSFIQASTNNNANLSNLKSAKLKSAILEMKGSSNQDFRLFKRVEVSVISSNNASPFTLRVNNLMNDTKVLNIPVNPNDDLKSYFNSTSFTYRLIADIKSDTSITIDQEIPCDLAIEYTLSVQK